ncbi:eukaryotic translation initiation factor 2A isoform X2 [Phalaenopsis equestris]|uniref:eukaryotic translation initiation factor 2A isoform X2 n=1 Tax=Phalaenopsis equestris TaxID=78828 RepID=UPI0009E3BF80|nr:eukaryotic translation initiation factor 2A isoform X2 [Phalaenopsis equestris]
MNKARTLEILAREPEGFSIWSGPPFNDGQPKVRLGRVPCSAAKYSENGSRLMVTESNSTICVYDCNSSTKIKSFDIPAVSASTLSPCGTYLQTFQKSSTPQEKNVVLWLIETGAAVYQHFQKNMTKTTWPVIQFSSDESIACRMSTNEIQFFDGKNFSKGIIYRLRVPGVTAVELSKTPGSHIAAFFAESKGVPASVQIFSCNQDGQANPVARRSFFRCSSIQLNWNHGSTGLLAVAQSDVDKTNQSYYGESKLNYLTTDGSHEGLVPLRKEGPVHDVQWAPSGSEFAVVYGFVPSSATIFDKKCRPLLELGTGPYNTIRWNPKGKFLCLAGFGNLPGDMAFWDYSEKRLLGTTKAECSVSSEWSPDGLYFMTATTAPRLQVDNGIKIFHYNGSLYFKKMFEKLYQTCRLIGSRKHLKSLEILWILSCLFPP